MNSDNKKLYLEQIDKKIMVFGVLKSFSQFPEGWIYAIRSALGISLQQLGNRLKITPQSVKELEMREKNKTISLKSLEDAARALDMQLIYGFIPNKKNLAKMIEDRADKIAQDVVLKTAKTMQLESQANSKSRIKKAIKERKKEIIDNMPRYLWDM